MTVANRITVFRILLTPVFVVLSLYYGESVERNDPQEWLRYAAIAVFVIAAASDGLDGWVARRFNQKSRLGVILDPIADKGLLLTAIITLTFSQWTYQFPKWFPVVVIARDILIVLGCGILKLVKDDVEISPIWSGKVATALQMVALSWVMLQLPYYEWPVYAAGFFTIVSLFGYIFRGLKELGDHAHPEAKHE